jgi:hypothetical protein
MMRRKGNSAQQLATVAATLGLGIAMQTRVMSTLPQSTWALGRYTVNLC